MIPAQVAFRQGSDQLPEGLRSRKKIKTRLAIEDAALQLFEEQGYDATTVEQIAELAEVSTTTFFRYFPTKAEVVLSDHGQQLPALHQAIVDRPKRENDLDAIRYAVRLEWVAAIDAARTARKARAVAASPVLQGLSHQRGYAWLTTVTDALAQRRDENEPNERCILTARVALGVLGTAVEGWIAAGCAGDLAEAIDHHFDLVAVLSTEWSKRRRA